MRERLQIMTELKSILRGEKSLPYTFWGWYITPLGLAFFGLVIWFSGTAMIGYGEMRPSQYFSYYVGMLSFILIPLVLAGSGYAVIQSALKAQTLVIWRISAIIIVICILLLYLLTFGPFYFVNFL
jgi:hypothetical protein